MVVIAAFAAALEGYVKWARVALPAFIGVAQAGTSLRHGPPDGIRIKIFDVRLEKRRERRTLSARLLD